jgi:hypothetical protein
MTYRRFHFRHKETIVTILAEKKEQYELAVEAILRARREIEEMIRKDPYFLITYEPYELEIEESREVVSRMIRASRVTGVGPMAAVAGTIASVAVEAMMEAGEFALVDNGGDIAMYANQDITIGIYTPVQLDIGFKINPGGFYSVCTSSGTVGHSVSLGFADAVTVFSKDASIADCFATKIGNMIGERDGKEEIQRTLESIWESSKDHIDGVIVLKNNIIGKIGKVPELRKVKLDADLITKG